MKRLGTISDRYMKMERLILGSGILSGLALLAIYVALAFAEAQAFDTMYLGDGWYRHSFSDGTTGYSMPMGDGWSRHSFSDGTSGYTMPLHDPQHTPSYGWQVPYLETPQLHVPRFNF